MNTLREQQQKRKRLAASQMRKVGEILIEMADKVESEGWECLDAYGGIDVHVSDVVSVVQEPLWDDMLEGSSQKPDRFFLKTDLCQSWRKP